MPTNCIYKTVNLIAGEKFILPPGAEIVSVSDDGVIESSCPDTLFPVAETKCYTMAWTITFDTEGTINYFPLLNVPIIIPEANNAWDNEGADKIKISFYSIAGVSTALGTDADDFVGLESALASSPYGGLLSERKYNSEYRESVTGVDSVNWNGDFKSGYTIYYFSFKATEEIAKTVYLEFFGPTENTGTIPRYFAQEIDCADYPATSQVASGGSPLNPLTTTTTSTTTTTTTP